MAISEQILIKVVPGSVGFHLTGWLKKKRMKRTLCAMEVRDVGLSVSDQEEESHKFQKPLNLHEILCRRRRTFPGYLPLYGVRHR